MRNASQAEQIFVIAAFILLLIRTITSLEIGKEVWVDDDHFKYKIVSCSVQSKRSKYPQVEVLSWPELASEWASIACETRPGPNFVLRLIFI